MQVSNSCVEEFEFGTQNFEDVLVVDSRITDELKPQEVGLSRTFRLENEEPQPEPGATVSIVDDQQNVYSFSETEAGNYVSDIAFRAMPDVSYQLQITTDGGESYTSKQVRLPQTTQIDDLYAEPIVNDDGEEGIGIFVDTFDPSGNADFYRYEYEETFQIIAPFWSNQDINVISRTPPVYEVVQREREERVCYKSEFSNRIILNETTGLNENNVERFMVNFVPTSDFKIRDRYSILVKQFVQSQEAYEFFELLKDFSDLESLLSQIQPGFVTGNLTSVNRPDDKVLGFFEVTSVSEKRIFINRRELFPRADRPAFPLNCTLTRIDNDNPQRIVDAVELRGLKLVQVGTNGVVLVFKSCSDCTVLGSNIRPDFWED
ncbi:DUF4249 domain-containing protein [Aquimarina spongiae]|uniref:DUF4249 domain-containing protein n=1 Tax=Aquimarina spongiae TaxID=570521 RepID=A0A1M6G9K2_9FLAO|nr:DUF4249 domain-containing protein [Aquimarina spongiae]SHJ06655.1 protein of unknown function [Aquimarina spongiae]